MTVAATPLVAGSEGDAFVATTLAPLAARAPRNTAGDEGVAATTEPLGPTNFQLA